MDRPHALALLRDEHHGRWPRAALAYLAEVKGGAPCRAIARWSSSIPRRNWATGGLRAHTVWRTVHAPWALAIGAAVRERLGTDLYAIWTDDGIAIRLPEGLEDGPIVDLLFPDADTVEDRVVKELGGSALFAARFRENAARALLLPRRRGDARTPLWQMRQRAADLLAVASRFGSFPILLETYRECLQDVFDLPALQEVLRGIEQRQIRVSTVETPSASPFARS
jgi:ATP-dependent Lhr-like helicase